MDYSQQLEKLIETRNLLLNPTEEFSNNTLNIEFKTALKAGQTKNVAVKSVLNKYLSNRTMKGRFIKTAGGFLALGLAINPIDKFVESKLL